MPLTVQQPYFLPWLGFLAKVTAAKTYVVLDDAAFRRNHLGRTAVRATDGAIRHLTLPIGASQSQRLNEIFICPSDSALTKIRNQIRAYYLRARHFRREFDFVDSVLVGSAEAQYDGPETLAGFNVRRICSLLEYLGLQVPNIVLASQVVPHRERTDRIVLLAQHLGATKLIVGDGGSTQVHDLAQIAAHGIEVRVMPFFRLHPRYEQHPYAPGQSFVPGCSCIDALLNVGRTRTCELIQSVAHDRV